MYWGPNRPGLEPRLGESPGLIQTTTSAYNVLPDNLALFL